MVKFLQSNIQTGQEVKINLRDILGLGGESLVVKILYGQGASKTFKAFKVIPQDGQSEGIENYILKTQIIRMKTEDQFVESAKGVTEQANEAFSGLSEYDCSSIIHENTIKYENITANKIYDYFSLIAGTLSISDCSGQ